MGGERDWHTCGWMETHGGWRNWQADAEIKKLQNIHLTSTEKSHACHLPDWMESFQEIADALDKITKSNKVFVKCAPKTALVKQTDTKETLLIRDFLWRRTKLWRQSDASLRHTGGKYLTVRRVFYARSPCYNYVCVRVCACMCIVYILHSRYLAYCQFQSKTKYSDFFSNFPELICAL